KRQTRDRVARRRSFEVHPWFGTGEVHMETKMWLVRAVSVALVGSLTWGASAQKPPKKRAPAPAPAPAAPPAPPAPPPKPTTPEQEEEGPFAPKGRTGKLREEAKPEEDKGETKAEKPKAQAPEKPG